MNDSFICVGGEGDSVIKENYGLKIKTKEKEGDRKRCEMLAKSVTRENVKHTYTVKVNTKQGLPICLIIRLGDTLGRGGKLQQSHPLCLYI